VGNDTVLVEMTETLVTRRVVVGRTSYPCVRSRPSTRFTGHRSAQRSGAANSRRSSSAACCGIPITALRELPLLEVEED
jgi:hypothetical protein